MLVTARRNIWDVICYVSFMLRRALVPMYGNDEHGNRFKEACRLLDTVETTQCLREESSSLVRQWRAKRAKSMPMPSSYLSAAAPCQTTAYARFHYIFLPRRLCCKCLRHRKSKLRRSHRYHDTRRSPLSKRTLPTPATSSTLFAFLSPHTPLAPLS